jgi:hypothetical protein
MIFILLFISVISIIIGLVFLYKIYILLDDMNNYQVSNIQIDDLIDIIETRQKNNNRLDG